MASRINHAELPVNLPEKPSDDKVSIGLFWIADTLEQWKPGYRKCSSTYCLKHVMQKETGIYLTNGQFKWLLMNAGFTHKNAPGEISWTFNVMFNRAKMKKCGGREKYLEAYSMA